MQHYGRTTDDSFQSMLMVWMENNSYLYRDEGIPQQKKRPLSRQAEDSMDPNQFQPGNPSCDTAVRSPLCPAPSIHPSIQLT
jgi:hypothetical protein